MLAEIMIGYKVIVKEYSGNLLGDGVVYKNKDAALFKDKLEREKANGYARCGEAPDITFQDVNYHLLPGAAKLCRVGRMIHDLDSSTREDLVRAQALSKLTDEEKKVLKLK